MLFFLTQLLFFFQNFSVNLHFKVLCEKAGLRMETPGSLSLMLCSHAFQNVFHLLPFNKIGRKKRGPKSIIMADSICDQVLRIYRAFLVLCTCVLT